MSATISQKEAEGGYRMSKIRTPYRYDFVGSFLRPQALKDAKAAYQAGDIGEDELEQVMQREIARIVEKQKELESNPQT